MHYYGTYTAFSGAEVRSELLHAKDFQRFEMHKLHGDATGNKGMALFPRRIDGRYMMIGRQDNESLWLLSSDDLHVWNGGEKFYDYVAWLEYLIGRFLAAWGYLLNGEMKWAGEDDADHGTILVKDNQITALADE